MISTNAFNYVNVLDKAADASWKRENLLANNIANVDTPGYKRKDLDFQSLLKEELGYKNESLDAKIGRADLTQLNPMTYTDMAGYSYRMDGGNVDIDTENVELASEQIRYTAVTTSINQEFSRMRTVLS
ncbi:MAG: flagellar basal body rod protein FlgB [Blautia sp.]|nr:flagellar basal body rod protein FlgB [Blautia sp.]